MVWCDVMDVRVGVVWVLGCFGQRRTLADLGTEARVFGRLWRWTMYNMGEWGKGGQGTFGIIQVGSEMVWV